MSFLSIVNAKKAEAAGDNAGAKPAPKVNPFAKNPFKKPAAAAPVVKAPEANPADEKVEEKRIGRAPVVKAAPAIETDTEKLAKEFLSGKKKPTPIEGQEEADAEAATPEEKFEEEAHAAVKAAVEDVEPAETAKAAESTEAAEEEKPAEEEAKTEEAVEEKPKKKTVHRRTTKKTEEKTEAEAEEIKPAETKENAPAKLEKKTDAQKVVQVAHYKPVDILGQKVSYDEACQLVLAQFNDTNTSAQYEEDVLAQLDSKELRIESDMNPGTLKAVECALDALATDLLRNYIKTKQLNELLTNKDFGTAYALMAEYSDGKNIIDKQQSGFRALSSTDIGGTKVNMLAMIATTRMHLTFLQAVMDRIKSKQNMCITMSSAIKVENSMSMMGAQG